MTSTPLRALATVLLALGLLAGCGDTEIEPPEPERAGTSLPEDAPRLLDGLTRAIADGDADAAAALAVPGSEGQLRAVVGNARELGLRDVSMRYLSEATPDEQDGAGGGVAAPSGAQVAIVELAYRLPWDKGATELETSVVVGTGSDDEPAIQGFGPLADRTPLWLTGEVHVRSSGRVHVLAVDVDRVDGLLAQGRRALADVSRVLPDWRGDLVLEAPSSGRQLEAVIGAEPGQYGGIAAVTSSVDGSLTPTAPVHVLLNPDVFDKLGGRGAQVVMSHEATHVATEATLSGMPRWLSEGFADYVALAAGDVPVRTAAAQALAAVEKDGPPERLPTEADLDPRAGGLGATYEEAWLACRFLAEQHGEGRLVAFYEAVDEGASTQQAFHDVLGTTEEAFVQAWADDMAALSGSGT